MLHRERPCIGNKIEWMHENKKDKLGHHLEITEVHLNIFEEQLFPNIKNMKVLI